VQAHPLYHGADVFACQRRFLDCADPNTLGHCRSPRRYRAGRQRERSHGLRRMSAQKRGKSQLLRPNYNPLTFLIASQSRVAAGECFTSAAARASSLPSHHSNATLYLTRASETREDRECTCSRAVALHRRRRVPVVARAVGVAAVIAVGNGSAIVQSSVTKARLCKKRNKGDMAEAPLRSPRCRLLMGASIASEAQRQSIVRALHTVWKRNHSSLRNNDNRQKNCVTKIGAAEDVREALQHLGR
jgi:hypothetical protein